MFFFSELLHTACYNQTSHAFIEPELLCKPSHPTSCNSWEDAVCRQGYIPRNEQLASFDNIFVSVLTILQIITMEDWILFQYKVPQI